MSETNVSTKLKRKRSKNTTTEQLEQYLQFMENDYHFRSGTNHSGLEPNYIENKWMELTTILNSMGDGPNLTVEEWKKRFVDWKYTCRSKFRKITQHRTQTGSGQQTQLTMSNLEERGLNVWGKVVVTGAPQVTSYEGIQDFVDIKVELELDDPIQVDDVAGPSHVDTVASPSHVDTVASPSRVDAVTGPSHVEAVADPAQVDAAAGPSHVTGTRKTERIRQKPLSVLAKQLIELTNNQRKCNADLVTVLDHFSKEYISIEKQKLAFEIAKYKFENKDFEFQE